MSRIEIMERREHHTDREETMGRTFDIRASLLASTIRRVEETLGRKLDMVERGEVAAAEAIGCDFRDIVWLVQRAAGGGT